MSILTTLSHIVSNGRAWRLRVRTFRQISELPHDLQKDIGFPGGDGFGDDIRAHGVKRH